MVPASGRGTFVARGMAWRRRFRLFIFGVPSRGEASRARAEPASTFTRCSVDARLDSMRLGGGGGGGASSGCSQMAASTPPLNAASSFVMSSSSEGARLAAVSRRAPWLCAAPCL